MYDLSYLIKFLLPRQNSKSGYRVLDARNVFLTVCVPLVLQCSFSFHVSVSLAVVSTKFPRQYNVDLIQTCVTLSGTWSSQGLWSVSSAVQLTASVQAASGHRPRLPFIWLDRTVRARVIGRLPVFILSQHHQLWCLTGIGRMRFAPVVLQFRYFCHIRANFRRWLPGVASGVGVDSRKTGREVQYRTVPCLWASTVL